MVKKKRIVSKLILALVVLTAISCCFLGSTFARYTSGGSGASSVEVAKWDVQFDAETETPVELGMISPAETAYDAGTHSSTPRKNEGEKVLASLELPVGGLMENLSQTVCTKKHVPN